MLPNVFVGTASWVPSRYIIFERRQTTDKADFVAFWVREKKHVWILVWTVPLNQLQGSQNCLTVTVPHSFLTPVSGPEIPAWDHMAGAHGDTDQSGLDIRAYNSQRRPPQHQNTGSRVFSCHALLLPVLRFFPKPLISKATSHQALGHSQNPIPVEQTIHDLRWFLRNDLFCVVCQTHHIILL